MKVEITFSDQLRYIEAADVSIIQTAPEQIIIKSVTGETTSFLVEDKRFWHIDIDGVRVCRNPTIKRR